MTERHWWHWSRLCGSCAKGVIGLMFSVMALDGVLRLWQGFWWQGVTGLAVTAGLVGIVFLVARLLRPPLPMVRVEMRDEGIGLRDVTTRRWMPLQEGDMLVVEYWPHGPSWHATVDPVDGE